MVFFRLLVVVTVVSSSLQLAPGAEDFAIRTRIFSGERSEPVAENLTIFHADKIYDFADTPPRVVTVFDTTTRRFVLAQTDRQVQTAISADELIRFAAAEQTQAQAADNELVRFAANPKFSESFDAASGRLSLTSEVWDYHVDTRRIDDRELLRRYAEFANWYTYLNALFRPLPPAARLELNRALDQHGRLPVRVVVQIKRDAQVIVEQQSRHELITQLGKGERTRIEDWQREQATYRSVDFTAYRGKKE